MGLRVRGSRKGKKKKSNNYEKKKKNVQFIQLVIG